MKIKIFLLYFIFISAFLSGPACAQYHAGLRGGINRFYLTGDIPENGMYQSLPGLGGNTDNRPTG
jgi:hypothetical protein